MARLRLQGLSSLDLMVLEAGDPGGISSVQLAESEQPSDLRSASWGYPGGVVRLKPGKAALRSAVRELGQEAAVSSPEDLADSEPGGSCQL